MSKRISIRLDDLSYNHVAIKAEQTGKTINQYLIDAGTNQEIKPVLPDDVRRAISGFGRNLNQISHIHNSAKKGNPALVEKLRAEVSELLKMILDHSRRL